MQCEAIALLPFLVSVRRTLPARNVHHTCITNTEVVISVQIFYTYVFVSYIAVAYVLDP